MNRHPITTSIAALVLAAAVPPGRAAGADDVLPDGTLFVSWEKPLRFTRTYCVDNRNPNLTYLL